MRIFGDKLPLVVDFVGFQFLWWACIVGGANHLVYPSVIAVLAYIGLHLFFVTKAVPRWQGLILLVIAGLVVDTVLIQCGVLRYPPTGIDHFPTPLWILILWLGLGFSTQASLSWLMGRPVLAFVLFGIAGAISYRAGIGFEAASMPITAAIGYPLIGLCFGLVGVALSSGIIGLRRAAG